MSAWYLVLVPLGVLALLLLFGFTGCDLIFPFPTQTIQEPGPDYPSTIKATKCIVGYWRLGDTPQPPKQGTCTSGGQARDELASDNGDYCLLFTSKTGHPKFHSPPHAASIMFGQPGLLDNPPAAASNQCIQVDGGYVQVPFSAKLNPAQFTFEAWVLPNIGGDAYPGTNYYCLVESSNWQAGGPTEQKSKGFGLYFGPVDPNTPGTYYWQVWMADGGTYSKVADSSQALYGAVPLPGQHLPNGQTVPGSGQVVYLALIYDGTNVELWGHLPGANMDVDKNNMQFFTAQATFSPNDTGNFYIGTGSSLFPALGAPSGPQPRLYPFKGKIQEVAFYNCALSPVLNLGTHVTMGTAKL